MLQAPKLLIFGIDGAAFGLTKAWMKAGHLPNLARLSNDGSAHVLRTNWPPHTGAGWTSLFTGKLPGEHGHYQFWKCQDPDYKLVANQRQDAGVPFLWDAMEEAGLRTALINIPMSHPCAGRPGVEVSWPLEVTLRFMHPRSLVGEIRDAGGLLLPDIACMNDGRPDYPARALDYIERRLVSLECVLQNHHIDVATVVFTELDRVQHVYWHGMDPTHPLHSDCADDERGVVLEIYQALDRALGRLLGRIGDDCAVMVVSDHGFGPGALQVNIHHLLCMAGYCAFNNDSNAFSDADPMLSSIEPMDWEKTLAYMPVPGSFGINLNVRGRQTAGQVKATDVPALERQIIDDLLRLEAPDGTRLLQAAIPARDCYPGTFAQHAPDILMVPRLPSTMIAQNLLGRTFEPCAQTGLHRLEGICIQRGLWKFDEETIPIEHITGLVAEAMNISTPNLPSARKCDTIFGSVLPSSAWSETADPWQDFGSVHVPSTTLNRSEAEPDEMLSNPEIADRLRLLGYI